MTEREMLPDELIIVSELVRRSEQGPWHGHDLTAARVTDMDDGGMGSLLFASSAPHRVYRKTVSEAWFRDSDGVPVVVSLNVDKDGELFEIHSWKVDFSSRKRLPQDEDELMSGPATMD